MHNRKLPSRRDFLGMSTASFALLFTLAPHSRAGAGGGRIQTPQLELDYSGDGSIAALRDVQTGENWIQSVSRCYALRSLSNQDLTELDSSDAISRVFSTPSSTAKASGFRAPSTILTGFRLKPAGLSRSAMEFYPSTVRHCDRGHPSRWSKRWSMMFTPTTFRLKTSKSGHSATRARRILIRRSSACRTSPAVDIMTHGTIFQSSL